MRFYWDDNLICGDLISSVFVFGGGPCEWQVAYLFCVLEENESYISPPRCGKHTAAATIANEKEFDESHPNDLAEIKISREDALDNLIY